MHRLFLAFFAFAAVCLGQTTTPNLGLILPPTNATNWGVITNYNMSKIDSAYGTGNVRSINGAAGTFTFTGSGFSNCTTSSGTTTCTFTGGSSTGAVLYSTTTRHAMFGDSLWVVGTHNSSQDDAATAFSCDGTHCTFTVATPSNPWYAVGNRVQFTGNVTGYALWSPGCVNFSEAVITNVSGSTIQINEADTSVPGHAGCTGTVSGTGGTVYNAENLAPSQLVRLPYFTNGSAVTPQLFNRGWPGQPLADLATNIATYAGDLNPSVTGIPAEAWVMSDDVCGDNTVGAWQLDLSTIMTYLHAHGWYVNLMTIPNAHAPTACGLGPVSVDSFLVNRWINAQQCTKTGTASPSPCADKVIDTWALGLNDWSDPLVAQQSGNFADHLTTEGAADFASILNAGRVAKDRPRGQPNAGLGPNEYNDVQHYLAGFSMLNTLWSEAGGEDIINGIGTYRPGYGYFNYRQDAGHCWGENGPSYNDSNGGGCITAAFQGGSTYSHTLAIGSGSFPSTATHIPLGDPTGNLYFTLWYLHGINGDITCSGLIANDSSIWYNYATGQLRGCVGGTATTLAGGGFTNPMTTLGDTLYGGASGTPTRLAGPTTNAHAYFLEALPTGAAVAPIWGDFAAPPAIGGMTPAPGSFSSVKNTGAAASSGHSCLQIDTSGVESNTGSSCGSSSGGSNFAVLGGSTLTNVNDNKTVPSPDTNNYAVNPKVDGSGNLIHEIPAAATSTPGLVKCGTGTSCAADGTLSVTGGGSSTNPLTRINPTRALSTIYQNTGSFPLIVAADIGSSNTITVLSDASSTPTTTIWSGGFSPYGATATFIVQPSYYYEVTSSGGSVGAWTEWAWTSGTFAASANLAPGGGGSGARNSGPTYTNSSGGLMMVQIGSGGSGCSSVTINGSAVQDNSAGSSGIFFIVPNGGTYSYACTGGTLSWWSETTTTSHQATMLNVTSHRTIGSTTASSQSRNATTFFAARITNTTTGSTTVAVGDTANPLSFGYTIGGQSCTSGNLASGTGFAMPGESYQVNSNNTSPTYNSWWEWTIN